VGIAVYEGQPSVQRLIDRFFIRASSQQHFGRRLHDLRAAYGWTDEQIIDQVALYGVEWLLETWKYIQEDKIDHYRMLMALMPLARTSMDKKAGSAQQSYSRSLERSLREATPWRKASGRVMSESLRRKGLEDGKVVVLLDGSESANDPLYADAKIIRE